MILSDYKCSKCNFVFEDLRESEDVKFSTCPSCGGVAKQQLRMRHRYQDYVCGWWRDLGPEPIYIRSRRHLRDVVRQRDDAGNGCYIPADDGILGV